VLDAARATAEGRFVPLRFELGEDAEASLAFAYSPLLEAVLSLHVLTVPKHHALQHQWVRASRSLPPELKREITALSFLYRWTIPDCILPSSVTGYDEFDGGLAQLRSLRPDVAAFEFLRPLWDHGGGVRPQRRRILGDTAVRAQALKRAGTIGAGARGAATLLFDDPAALLARFASLLEAYWAEAFAAEWRRIEPSLAESVVDAGRRIARDGVYGFLTGLAPQLRIEPGNTGFGLDIPHHHRVALHADNPLLLVPSVYVWPHVRINCDPPWPLVLVYRAPHLVESLRHATRPELVRTLRALADPTRLRILQQVARRPRSTQELAPVVGLSEPGTSKHLRALAEAGLLERRREGYYVVYSIVPERLETLSGDLRRLAASVPQRDGYEPGE
jgi:DNA-binding transcriptional ArsR family regulator